MGRTCALPGCGPVTLQQLLHRSPDLCVACLPCSHGFSPLAVVFLPHATPAAADLIQVTLAQPV